MKDATQKKRNIGPFLLRTRECSCLGTEFFIVTGEEVTEEIADIVLKRLEEISKSKGKEMCVIGFEWEKSYISFSIRHSLSERMSELVSSVKRAGTTALGYREKAFWKKGYYCRSIQIVSSTNLLNFAMSREGISLEQPKEFVEGVNQ